ARHLRLRRPRRHRHLETGRRGPMKPPMRFRTAILLLLLVRAVPAPPPENPWPRIRKERIQKLLPAAMERAGVDAWILICRENDNDPLAAHVGGENAGGAARFLFFRK